MYPCTNPLRELQTADLATGKNPMTGYAAWVNLSLYTIANWFIAAFQC
jgi:hypothetical protein